MTYKTFAEAILRNFLGWFGVWLSAHGIISTEDGPKIVSMTPLILGSLLALGTFLWSLFNAWRKHQEKLVALQVETLPQLDAVMADPIKKETAIAASTAGAQVSPQVFADLTRNAPLVVAVLVLCLWAAPARASGWWGSGPPLFAQDDCIAWATPTTCTSQVCDSTKEVSSTNCCSPLIYAVITAVHDKNYDVTCRSLVTPGGEMKTSLTFEQAKHYAKIRCPPLPPDVTAP